MDCKRVESDPYSTELVGVRVVLAACGWVEQWLCFACSPSGFRSTCEQECASHTCAILASECTFGAFVTSPSAATGFGYDLDGIPLSRHESCINKLASTISIARGEHTPLPYHFVYGFGLFWTNTAEQDFPHSQARGPGSRPPTVRAESVASLTTWVSLTHSFCHRQGDLHARNPLLWPPDPSLAGP